VKVDHLGGSDHVLHVRVTLLGTNTCFNVSIIYRDNISSHQEALLYDIVRYSHRWEDTPWFLMGNFNAIWFLVEKRGGAMSWES